MNGTDLKVARVRADVKLKDVAREMGISSSRLSRIEVPASNPADETVRRYLDALEKCRTSGTRAA
jgi:predicted transcriptional regulator